MSRHWDCHDNNVAESFFQLLKRERKRRRKYPTHDDARRDVFEYIDLFYNSKRKHTNNGMKSPPLTHALHVLPALVGFKIRQRKLNGAGVWETRGTSRRPDFLDAKPEWCFD